MTITLIVFLYLFLGFLAVFFLFFFINVRDILSSYALNLTTITVTTCIVFLTFATLAVAGLALEDVDWGRPLFSASTDVFRQTTIPSF